MDEFLCPFTLECGNIALVSSVCLSVCYSIPRAVSGYFGNGARAFEIGKNSVVLVRIGKNFNKLKKSVISFAFRDISGKWT